MSNTWNGSPSLANRGRRRGREPPSGSQGNWIGRVTRIAFDHGWHYDRHPQCKSLYNEYYGAPYLQVPVVLRRGSCFNLERSLGSCVVPRHTPYSVDVLRWEVYWLELKSLYVIHSRHHILRVNCSNSFWRFSTHHKDYQEMHTRSHDRTNQRAGTTPTRFWLTRSVLPRRSSQWGPNFLAMCTIRPPQIILSN